MADTDSNFLAAGILGQINYPRNRSSMQYSLSDDTTDAIQVPLESAAVHQIKKPTVSASTSSSSVSSWDRLSSTCGANSHKPSAGELQSPPLVFLFPDVCGGNSEDQAHSDNPLRSTDTAYQRNMSVDVSEVSRTTACNGVESSSGPPMDRLKTFFSDQKYRFSEVELTEESDIPTTIFLEACRGLATLFDLLGSRTFAPVRMDMLGNIGKLQKKFDTNPSKYSLLLSMMRQEIEDETTLARNSSTDALLWLKRGVEFIYEFFVLFLRGDPDLTNCTSAAYDKTLRKYHGWMARGLFAVANRAIPYRKDFTRMLALNPAKEVDQSEFEQQVYADCANYIKDMAKVLKAINQFYQENNLDSDEVV